MRVVSTRVSGGYAYDKDAWFHINCRVENGYEDWDDFIDSKQVPKGEKCEWCGGTFNEAGYFLLQCVQTLCWLQLQLVKQIWKV
jgi:hypothetical protein